MGSLYISHTGMSEPLGRSQVIPYLQGLARAGWRIDVVGFEPSTATADEIADAEATLARDGIQYHWTRRSTSHSLPTKLLESTRAFAALLARAARRRPRIVHARSYLPAAVARAVAQLIPGARFIFDCRGLLGDEYVDAGHWRRDSLRYRLLKAAERELFGRADAVVVLTDRVRRWLVDEAHLVADAAAIDVIPCCTDLERFAFDGAARTRVRGELGAADRLVLAYSGTLGSWYREAEIATLFAAVRRRRPALLAVFTRSASDRLRAELRRRDVADSDVVIRAVGASEMPAMLSAADAAVSFIDPCFSKIASSPVKVPEYLAVGLPVVANRGIGDQDALMQQFPQSFIDAGAMTDNELAAAADRVAALPPLDDLGRKKQRAIAEEHFSLDRVGVARYRALYHRLAG